MKFKNKFNICGIDFEFNVLDISKAFRINVNKIDLLVDFDNRSVIKLSKTKGHLRLCNASVKRIKPEVISVLKTDTEFMDQIIRCIKLIMMNYHPVKLDYSDIMDSPSVMVNENPLCTDEIEMRWTRPEVYDDSKLIITIF
jgi:hypothetical protein